MIIAYSAVRFRAPDDDDRPAEAQFTSGWLFVSVWVGLSVVLNVIFVFYRGIFGLEQLWAAAAAENPLVVEVTGKQWEWDFHYPDQDISTVNELVVPVDRPVRFELHSDDVMHSFWVPAWGVKKAVMPGETRVMVVNPTEVLDTADDPEIRVQCAQICGIGHARMRSDVRVVAGTEFDSWVTAQKAGTSGNASMDGSMPGMNMAAPATKDMGSMTGKDAGSATTGGSDMSGMKMDAKSPGADMTAPAGGDMGTMDMSGSGGTATGNAAPTDATGSGN